MTKANQFNPTNILAPPICAPPVDLHHKSAHHNATLAKQDLLKMSAIANAVPLTSNSIIQRTVAPHDPSVLNSATKNHTN